MNKLLTIYKHRGKYYAFRFDTEVQNHCENFMAWHVPSVNYWMASDSMFRDKEQNYYIDTQYPYNYLIDGKFLMISDVHVHKRGSKFTL